MAGRVSSCVVSSAVCALLALFVCSAARSESQQPKPAATSAQKSDPYRLPEYAQPQSYDVDVTPDLEKATFTGAVQIKLKLTKASNQIVLNAVNLTIDNVSIKAEAGQAAKGAVSFDKQTERTIITFTAALKPGDYVLSMHYTGSLNDKLRGFYRSSYKDASGKQAYMAVTQMEATDARRMFPCFDEPSFKATFKLTARIAPNLVAIGNVPIENESIDEKSHKKIVRFEATPRMSSYLVALMVGDFKPTQPVMADGIPVRVWCAGRDPALGNYSRDTAAKVVPFLNSYFKINYPWKKLDLIAIPDFDAGAMENPGAVTFRESLLLIDEKTASLRSRQSMASVVAHELAHMWFGDLVTMRWWDDLWLNEAFATWMAIKTVSAVVPEWDYMTTFGEERQQAMRTDATRATRAIHSAVRDPQEAQQMFDEITYEKGASVLRMLEVFTGEDEFREGIRRYMEKFSYANAATADLWKALEEASGKPVSTMMNAWANQSGYPLISVVEKEGKLNFRQERFWLRPEKAESTALWQVPITLRYFGDAVQGNSVKADQASLLRVRTEEIGLEKADSDFIVNAGGFGYYRVSYSPPLFKKLLTHVSDRMTALERLSLVGDQFALCIAGKVDLHDYMSVIEICRNETDPDVWDTILDQLRYVNLFVDKATRPSFEKFVQNLLRPTQTKLGWVARDGDSDKTKMLRGKIIGVLGTIGGDTAVITEVRKLFGEYVKAPSSVDPNMIDAITTVVAFNGKQADFDQITKLWKASKTPEVEKRNLFALTAFREPALRSKVLQMSLQSQVRPQDGSGLVSSELRSMAGKAEAWTFVQQNWPAIKKRFTDHMQTGIASSCDQFVDEEHCGSIAEFFKTHKIEAGNSSINRMLERLQINRQFSKQAGAQLSKWLSSRKDS